MLREIKPGVQAKRGSFFAGVGVGGKEALDDTFDRRASKGEEAD
jgi:hypothetical protein